MKETRQVIVIAAAMMTSPAARHLVIAFPSAPVCAVAMTGAVAHAQIIALIPASHAIPKRVSVKEHANLTVLVRSVARMGAATNAPRAVDRENPVLYREYAFLPSAAVRRLLSREP